MILRLPRTKPTVILEVAGGAFVGTCEWNREIKSPAQRQYFSSIFHTILSKFFRNFPQVGLAYDLPFPRWSKIEDKLQKSGFLRTSDNRLMLLKRLGWKMLMWCVSYARKSIGEGTRVNWNFWEGCIIADQYLLKQMIPTCFCKILEIFWNVCEF